MAFDSISQDARLSGDAGTSLTFSHTCGASATVLFVQVVIEPDQAFRQATGATYDGVNMTELVNTTTSDHRQQLFFLANPTTGSAATVEITNDNSSDMAASAVSFADVDTTQPTPSTNTGSGDPASVTISSASGRQVVDFLGAEDGGGSNPVTAVGTGQTQRGTGTEAGRAWAYVSTKDGASSVTMEWSINQAFQDWVHTAVDLVPASTGTTVTVGLTTETDTAFGVTAVNPNTIAVGQVSETDSAFAVTVGSSAVTATVGLASETDITFAVTANVEVKQTVGLALEADSAFAVTASADLSQTVGLASETASAFGVTALNPNTVTIGQAVETDSAPSVTAINGVGAESTFALLVDITGGAVALNAPITESEIAVTADLKGEKALLANVTASDLALTAALDATDVAVEAPL